MTAERAGVRAEDVDVDAPVRGRPRQWDVTLAVAVGGVLGAEARYGLGLAVPHAPSAFAWSTVVINVVGCCCLGVLMSVLGQLTAPPRLLRPFVGIGVLGGFTTFSTFAVDAQRLLVAHRPGTALLYALCTLVTAAAAVAAGTAGAGAVGRRVRRRGRRRGTADRA